MIWLFIFECSDECEIGITSVWARGVDHSKHQCTIYMNIKYDLQTEFHFLPNRTENCLGINMNS